MRKITFLTIGLFLSNFLYSQLQWDGQKHGSWRFESNLPEKGYKLRNATLTTTDNLMFRKI